MYSAVVAIPSSYGNFGIQVDYFGFKNYNESQLGIVYAKSLGSKLDIGIKFNYYSFRIPTYQSSSTSNFEIETIVHLSEKLHAGMHFYNPVGGNLSKVLEIILKTSIYLIVDTLNSNDFVSSLQTSGYHRTASEVADKGSEGQLTLGGNINYSNDHFHIGINGVHYNFEHNISKPVYLYNAYALSGKAAGNYSIDYSYTFRNLHFFGEAATSGTFDKAFVNGLLISVDPHVGMSFLYRNISRGYQSLYSNAFTENTFPTNESGFYSGITISPVNVLRIDAYADFYHFPWLKTGLMHRVQETIIFFK